VQTIACWAVRLTGGRAVLCEQPSNHSSIDLSSHVADVRGQNIVVERKLTGTVKSFDLAKGFGYIRTDELAEPVFVHYESIVDDPYRMLGVGDKVEFALYASSTGPRAVEVKKL